MDGPLCMVTAGLNAQQHGQSALMQARPGKPAVCHLSTTVIQTHCRNTLTRAVHVHCAAGLLPL